MDVDGVRDDVEWDLQHHWCIQHNLVKLGVDQVGLRQYGGGESREIGHDGLAVCVPSRETVVRSTWPPRPDDQTKKLVENYEQRSLFVVTGAGPDSVDGVVESGEWNDKCRQRGLMSSTTKAG